VKKLIKDKKAQAVVEYIFVVCFVFLFSIALSKFFAILISNFLKNFIFIFSFPIP